MKLRIATCKKLGLPEYSSVGSTCQIELELSDSADGQAVVDAIRRLPATCDPAVAEHLAAHAGTPAAAAPPSSPQAPSSKPRFEWQSARPSNMTAAGRLANGVKSNGFNRQGQGPGPNKPPRSGRELAGWAKTQGERIGVDLTRELAEWGKEVGVGWQIREWDGDTVRECYDAFAPRVAEYTANGREGN